MQAQHGGDVGRVQGMEGPGVWGVSKGGGEGVKRSSWMRTLNVILDEMGILAAAGSTSEQSGRWRGRRGPVPG